LADEVKRSLGDSCVPVILNGACGNINPWPPFDPDYADDHRLIGRALSKVVLRVMEKLEFAEEAAVDYATKRIKIPLREIEEERLKWAQEKLRSQPPPAWRDERRESVDPEWVMAAGLLGLHRLRERQPDHEYEIQAFRIGDVAIVGLPGEPFVEGGLRIKLGSPTYPTYVVHCVNQYVGYIPTADAWRPRSDHKPMVQACPRGPRHDSRCRPRCSQTPLLGAHSKTQSHSRRSEGPRPREARRFWGRS